MKLRAEKLTVDAFRPFGAVVSATERTDCQVYATNLGTADRRNFLVDVVSLRQGARLNVATFHARPWKAEDLRLGVLERHEMSTQMFVPMTPGPFLVVVAEGKDAPDVATARAFYVAGGMGVAYAPGTWHHPMIVLGEAPVDFTCLVWEDGTAHDCEVHRLATALEIDLGELPNGRP